MQFPSLHPMTLNQYKSVQLQWKAKKWSSRIDKVHGYGGGEMLGQDTWLNHELFNSNCILIRPEASFFSSHRPTYSSKDQRGFYSLKWWKWTKRICMYPEVTHTRSLLIYPGNCCRVADFLFAQVLPAGLSSICETYPPCFFHLATMPLRWWGTAKRPGWYQRKYCLLPPPPPPPQISGTPRHKKGLLANNETKSANSDPA